MNKMKPPLLVCEEIRKSYQTEKTHALEVLKGIDLTVDQGEIIAIVGHSGAGKSTLLHVLGALDQPTHGRVLINGRDLSGFTVDALSEFRNRSVGFVFQFHYLLPEFTALENTAMPALIRGEERAPALERAESLLQEVDLQNRMTHRPRELSGGEQQRVAFARAMMNDPLLVLADEPSGNLDLKNSQALHQLMWNMVRKMNKTCVVVTHNQELAGQADRVITLKDGAMVGN